MGMGDTTRRASRHQGWRPMRAVIAVGVVATAVLFGYWVGMSNKVEELTGAAFVGDRVFTADIGGWSYGASEGVAWIDSDGTWHDRGWPSCLETHGPAQVRFGATEVSGPTGRSWREVVWVDCR